MNMYMLAFVVLVACIAAGGGFGLWAGSWLYHLCPLKGNLAYMSVFILCPIVCITVAVTLVMPVVHFLVSVGRKG